jgi:tetratricopeptide (TPR) repeat protein
VFSTPESAKISDEFVSVHILGGDDLDEAGSAFMELYSVQGYPTLLAVTAGGGLVDGDLMDGQFRDASYLLEAMHRARSENEAFVAKRDALAGKTDLASMQELADLYEQRRNATRSRELYEKILATTDEPKVDTYNRLLAILRLQKDRDAEQEALDALVKRFPAHDDRMAWRARLATLHIDPPESRADLEPYVTKVTAALEELRKQVADAGDVEGEAGVRTHLASIAGNSGEEEEFEGHVAWILEKAPDSAAAREIRLLLIRRAMQRREMEAAKEHAQWIVDNAPESRQAAEAHMVLGDLAYGEGDNDAMQAHFEAVVRLAPESRMGGIAKGVLDMLAEQAAQGDGEDGGAEDEGDAPPMGD